MSDTTRSAKQTFTVEEAGDYLFSPGDDMDEQGKVRNRGKVAAAMHTLIDRHTRPEYQKDYDKISMALAVGARRAPVSRAVLQKLDQYPVLRTLTLI
jgi:hypothetical protein